MRIALAGYGTRGDVQPLVALGVRLRSEGHQVIVGAAGGFAGLVRAHGLEFHCVGTDLAAWIQDHRDVFSRPLSALRPLVRHLHDEVALSFEQTLEAASDADLIVSGVHVAAPSVAEALGVPYRALLFCPQLLFSRHHPPPCVPWFDLPASWNEQLWRVFIRGFDVVMLEEINRGRRDLGLAPVASTLDYWQRDDVIVASDAVLGALPPDAPPGVIQIGSLALADERPLEPALERFIEHGEPPVYVGFGSMPDEDPLRTTVMIGEALESCRRRGVILAGWAGLGESGVPPGVFVTHAVSHAQLLPRVALAVHHGGAGTTAAVARAGVPQIVVPHAADQFYWGHQVYVLGLGSSPIGRNALTAEKLAHAMDEVFSRPDIAIRARDLGARLRPQDGVARLARMLVAAASDGPASRAAA